MRGAACVDGITAFLLDQVRAASHASHFQIVEARAGRGVCCGAEITREGQVGALIRATSLTTKQFAQGLQETGFEVLNDVGSIRWLVSFGTSD